MSPYNKSDRIFNSTILYLKDNGVLRIFEIWLLRVPLILIPTQNGGMQVLFNKFQRGKNLVALLFSNSVSRNKTMCYVQNLEIWKFEGSLRIVCNRWKVFTRPTCIQIFFSLWQFNPFFSLCLRMFVFRWALLSEKLSLRKSFWFL
jgi:hypothetical protein